MCSKLRGAIGVPHADAEQVPYYLETFTERNVQFYGKLGFRVLVHDRIPGGGPPFWTIVRMPQP
jgi:hypothetical protein